jgi:hypothetical protein
MKRVKVLFMAVFAVSAFAAIMAGSASAQCAKPCLPTVLLVTGGTLPLTIESEKEPNTIKSTLENAGGSSLNGEGLLLQLSFTNLKDMSDSSYLTLFLNVGEPKENIKCNTEGDKTGEILLPTNLFLLVGITQGQKVGVLLLVNEFAIKCGGLTIKIKGSALSQVTAGVGVKSAKGSNTTKASLHCTSAANGTPELSKYFNESGTETLIPTLLSNFGAGFVKSCEEIVPTTIALLPSQEIELMEG